MNKFDHIETFGHINILIFFYIIKDKEFVQKYESTFHIVTHFKNIIYHTNTTE